MGEQVNTIKHFCSLLGVVILKRDEIYDYLGSFPFIHNDEDETYFRFGLIFGYVEGLMTG